MKIAIGILGMILLGIAIIFAVKSQRSTQPTTPALDRGGIEYGNFPQTNQQTKPIIRGEKPSLDKPSFDIITQQGSITVNNVYLMPNSKPLSEDGTNFLTTNDFYLAYYPQQQGFLIALLNPDILTARMRAEKAFLETTGLTPDEACQLNVSLTISPETKSPSVGGNYGLSFCPDGKEFRDD